MGLVGQQAGGQAVRQSSGGFQNSLWSTLLRFLRGLTKIQCYYNVTNVQYFCGFFGQSVIVTYEVFCGGTKKWNIKFFM